MFVPLTSADEALHRHQLAGAVNASLRGETANTGQFTVNVGVTEYTLWDARLGVGKVLLLSPANAAAAASRWYVREILKGTATIIVTEPPLSAALFSYAITGEGNTRG